MMKVLKNISRKVIAGRFWRRRFVRRRFGRDCAGASIIEFALIAPILISIIAGIVDGGALFYLQNNMTTVARDTARSLSVGELTNYAEAQEYARGRVVNWGATFSVNVTVPDPMDPTDNDFMVELSVPIDDAALMDPFGIFNSGTLRATAVMRQE